MSLDHEAISLGVIGQVVQGGQGIQDKLFIIGSWEVCWRRGGKEGKGEGSGEGEEKRRKGGRGGEGIGEGRESETN